MQGPKARWAVCFYSTEANLTLVYTHRQFYLALPSLAVLLPSTSHAALDGGEKTGHPDNKQLIPAAASNPRPFSPLTNGLLGVVVPDLAVLHAHLVLLLLGRLLALGRFRFATDKILFKVLPTEYIFNTRNWPEGVIVTKCCFLNWKNFFISEPELETPRTWF